MKSQTTYREIEDYSPAKFPLAEPRSRMAANKGSVLAYLATVLSTMAQELAHSPKKDSTCVLCSDAIFATQVTAEDEGNPVHAICLEMKQRKDALLQKAKQHDHACALCGQNVPPTGIFLHEAGLTLSYACAEGKHDEPNLFSLPVTTEESRRVGMWEAKLRERLKQKGFVRCCECGRLIHSDKARLLGPGWHYCGCLPELWRTGP